MAREIPKITLAELRKDYPGLARVYDSLLRGYFEYDKDWLRKTIKGRGYEGTLEVTEKLIDEGWLKMIVEEDETKYIKVWIGVYNPLLDKYECGLNPT